MTLYLAKYADDDYRLHRADGAEIVSFAQRYDGADLRVRLPGARGNSVALSNNEPALQDHLDIVQGDYVFRDVAEHGPSEIPFDVPNDVTLADGGPQRSD